MSAAKNINPSPSTSLISEQEFCERFGISKVSAWSLRSKGKISYYRILGKVYYSEEQIAEWVASCERNARPAKLIKKI